jgi:predicted RND superfamily exporter protein
MASERPDRGPTDQGYKVFEWINRHAWLLAGVLVLAGVAFAGLFVAVADDGEPAFDPGGEIYDTADRVEEVFASSSSTQVDVFIVEHPDGGDVLTRDSLLELKNNQDELLADSESQQHLTTSFDSDLGIEIVGVFSIADVVDDALPAGLEGATDGEVKAALSELLADGAPTASLRFLLSTTQTTREPGSIDGEDIVVWESPAFFARVVYDIDTFDPAQLSDSFDDETNLDAERWLRDTQVILRGSENEVTAIGVAIDQGLVGEEQNAASGPFIFAAVAFILIFVGALLRSYWAAMVVGAGLGVVMMGYNGFNAFLGLKTGSPLLILVVPIALISFGVDFFIHGSGRAREEQVDGATRERAYPLGETAVFAALLLAALSSIAAFLSNTVSGIEAIIEFGIASAIALALSYLILGWVAPRLLLSLEEKLGPRPDDLGHSRVVFQKIGFVLACFFAGIAVTLAIVFPVIGWAVYLIFLGLFIYVPYLFTRRRNRRAAEAGRPLTDEVKGAGHGFKAAGTVVHFLARWRVFTLPAVALLAAFGLWGAFQVEQGFEISDFFPSDTDLVKSIDKVDEFFGLAGNEDYIYVEGDLTSPETLRAIIEAEQELASAEADFVTDFNGDIEIGDNAVTVVALATSSGPARDAIETSTGIVITDDDGDGLADTDEQVAAVYQFAAANTLVNDEGTDVFRPDQTEPFLYLDGAMPGTKIQVSITSFTDDALILEARGVLDEAAANLEPKLADADIVLLSVSGDAITQQAVLDSFTSAMLTSLPVAVVLTAILVFVALLILFRSYGRRAASVWKRSIRYGLISMVPILLVVAWVYGFMYLVGYKINPITATIAAISIGVGVDYSTHFMMRFIEEFEGEASRFPALRRAGEGTGGALAISALTSMTGFLVLAASPFPLFQTFGVLTAVMIVFAASVSLLVLPSLLILITPSRKGEERAELEEAATGGRFTYEPHDRSTAIREVDED